MSDELVLLRGTVIDSDDENREVEADLRDEIRRLKAELLATRRDLDHAHAEATRALSSLRKQLGPLYRALQAVFGELEAAGVDDDPTFTAEGTSPRTTAVWASWKSRLPGGPAKIIDALLLHHEMNTQQLAIATGVHRNSIPAMIYKLNKAGLLNKNGGRFSLKSL